MYEMVTLHMANNCLSISVHPSQVYELFEPRNPSVVIVR